MHGMTETINGHTRPRRLASRHVNHVLRHVRLSSAILIISQNSHLTSGHTKYMYQMTQNTHLLSV